jgi:hypothetical protein
MAPVDVTGGTIELPFLRYRRDERIEGGPSTKLVAYRGQAPFTVDAATIAAATEPGFALPAALAARPEPAAIRDGAQVHAPASAIRRGAPGRLIVRAGRVRGGVVGYGFAPQGARVLVRLLRAGRTVAARRVTARYGAYRVRWRVRRAGRYRVEATTRVGGLILRARSPYLRVR